jgi:phosphatidylinositol-3-phosphatase
MSWRPTSAFTKHLLCLNGGVTFLQQSARDRERPASPGPSGNSPKRKYSEMNKITAILCLLAAGMASTASAQKEGPVPKGVPHLDHVWVIMMENHGYNQLNDNPNAPFINKLASSANKGTNYFAVGHPSLTNYLETVGGSNFGVRSDNSPDWHDTSCEPNILSGLVDTDSPSSPNICPIAGSGMDAETPGIDCTNETQTPPCLWDLVGPNSASIPSAPTVGKTIADQLFERGKSWKSYQEDLPPSGADLVNTSDGFFSNLTNFTPFITGGSFSSWSTQGVTIPAVMSQSDAQGDIVSLYAVKHNPFVYFKSVQDGANFRNSLQNVAGFVGPRGLYADLGSGNVPNFSFIAPNQCNDQHGRSNDGPFCNFDAKDNGTQSGLNETNILMGDISVQQIVSAIKDSQVWRDGQNAIVLLWDENDYTATPNQVLLVVDTNYGVHGMQSNRFYTHFSLLRSLEAGFELPCLNHACDSSTNVMSDLFAGEGRGKD